MVAYFVRRMLEAVAGWLLVALLLYSLIVLPAMNFVFQQICNDCGARPQIEKARLQHTYALDQPWPLNSFIWLLDPNITVQEYYVKGYLAMGGSVPSRTYYFERSGLLFGDLAIRWSSILVDLCYCSTASSSPPSSPSSWVPLSL